MHKEINLRSEGGMKNFVNFSCKIKIGRKKEKMKICKRRILGWYQPIFESIFELKFGDTISKDLNQSILKTVC